MGLSFTPATGHMLANFVYRPLTLSGYEILLLSKNLTDLYKDKGAGELWDDPVSMFSVDNKKRFLPV